MKHWAHLFRWELRRSWGLLAPWVAVVAANAVFHAAWPEIATHRGTRDLVGMVAGLTFVAEVLLSIVLIAQVAHADAPVGTQPFWLTRPIRPGTLLTAKLAFLGATLIGSKVVTEAIVMAIYAVPLRDAVGVMAQTTLLWTLWTTVLMTAAAVTSNFAKFALLIGGALVAFAVTIAMMAAVALSNRFDSAPPLSTRDLGSYDPTSNTIVSALLVIAALVVLVAQYRTRRRPLSYAIAAFGVLLTFVIGTTWPWPWLAPIVMTPAWTADPEMLALDADTGTVTVERGVWIRDQPVDWKEARAQLRMRGLEPGWTASVALRQATLKVPGKGELNNSYAANWSTVLVEGYGNEHQDREVVRRLLDVSSVVDERTPEQGENAIIMFTRESEIRVLAPAVGQYEGRFQVGLKRHVVEATLPLRTGAMYENGSYRLAIKELQLISGHISLLTQQSYAVSVFARRPRTVRTVYLRNRRLSQAILGSWFPLRRDLTLLGFVPVTVGFEGGERPGFSIDAQAMDFPPTYARRDVPALDETWLDEGELVIVKSTDEGRVIRELAIPDFPIRSLSAAGQR